MIDLHCHVLPRLDDGPRTTDAAISMIRAAVADGITTIVATPHVSRSYPHIGVESVASALGDLRDRVDEPLLLLAGAELEHTRAIELSDEQLSELSLGGAGWLLLECPHAVGPPSGFMAVARRLAARGHRIVLAHPERAPIFLHRPDLLDDLIAEGMLAQVTARALTGGFGRAPRALGRRLLERGSAQIIASDGHGPERPPLIAGALRGIVSDEVIDWTGQQVPEAILAGEIPPAGPGVPARRRLHPRSLVGRVR